MHYPVFNRRELGVAMKYLSESYRNTATKSQIEDDLYELGIQVASHYRRYLVLSLACVVADYVIDHAKKGSEER